MAISYSPAGQSFRHILNVITYSVAILAEVVDILEPPIQIVAPFSSEVTKCLNLVKACGCPNMLQIVTFWAQINDFRHICSNSPLKNTDSGRLAKWQKGMTSLRPPKP